MYRHYLAFLVVILFCTRCKKADIEVHRSIQLVEKFTVESNQDLDFITNFQFKSDGSVWIGTFNSGLYHVTQDGTIHYDTDNSPVPNNRVNDLYLDGSEKLWIATDNGFASYLNEDWAVFTIDNTPLFIERVSQIAVDSKSNVLVGNGSAIEGGLILFTSDGDWKTYTPDNSLMPCSLILDIEVTDENWFWVSTGQNQGKGGIVLLEGDIITRALNIEETGLLYNWIDEIEIWENSLWVGYQVSIYNEPEIAEGGIQLVGLEENEITSFFPHETGLTSNRIHSIRLSSDNLLWFTTSLETCQNCSAGIGFLNEAGEFLISSFLNSAIASNAFFPMLNEDHRGKMYVASELSLYELEIK